MKLNFSLMIALCAALLGGLATAASPYAAMAPVPLKDVRLTDGFWAERQAVNNEVSLKVLWDRANDPEQERNCAGEHGDVVELLRQALAAFMRERGAEEVYVKAYALGAQ